MWNLENGTDEPVCRAEIETQKQRKNVWTPREESGRGDGGGVMNWEIGTDMYTLMCIKWITNKNLLQKKINKIKLKEMVCLNLWHQNVFPLGFYKTNALEIWRRVQLGKKTFKFYFNIQFSVPEEFGPSTL